MQQYAFVQSTTQYYSPEYIENTSLSVIAIFGCQVIN